MTAPTVAAPVVDTTMLVNRETSALASRRRRRHLPVGWPMLVLFAGYPLWWAMGVAPFVALASAVPLALELRNNRPLRAPRGLGLWILFLLWLALGVAVLQVTAPEAIPSTSNGRYFVFAFRYAWFLAATIYLLYIGNMRAELDLLRVCRVIGVMFMVVVAGGLLGTVAPRLEFTSLLEIVGGGLGRTPFIQNLIHPSAAQIQDFLGYEQGRPSAPFPFTNQWGLNCAVTLPFFIVGWFHKASRSRKTFGSVVLLLALVPIVSSLNRGLWLALVVCAAFLAVRAALQGRPGVLAAGTVAVMIAAVLIALSPLGSLVAARLDNGNSNQGRTNLGTQTLLSTWQGSPVVGFGTTRDPAGNWVSIAAGSTAQCPRCTPPPMGTQGQFWFILFASGFVGVFLYYAFFLTQMLRHIRLKSVYATAGLAAVTMHLVTSPFYNSVDVSLLVILSAVGLLWRAGLMEQPDRGRAGTSDVALRWYPRLARRHWSLLLVCVVLGGAVGAGLQARSGTPAEAHQRVFVRDIRNGDTASGGELATIDFSLDTEANIIRSDSVFEAVRAAAGRPLSDKEILSRMRVTALPNTRILAIHVMLDDPERAAAAAQAAGRAYLTTRSRILNASRSQQLAILRARGEDLRDAAGTLGDSVPAARADRLNVVKDTLSRFNAQTRYADSTRDRLASNPLDVGDLVGTTSVEEVRDGWIIKTVSGMGLGLLTWAFLATLLHGSRRRIGSKGGQWRSASTTLPILATVDLSPGEDHTPAAGGDAAGVSGSAPPASRSIPELDLTGARTALRIFGPISGVLSPFSGAEPERVAHLLDEDLDLGDRRRGRVVLVASHRTRSLLLETSLRRIRRTGVEVVGLVVVR